MVSPHETFTDVLSTLCIVCREGEKKERAEGFILHFYLIIIIRVSRTIMLALTPDG